ncbi:unnamed protein product [Boreogadus saida]
MQPSLTSHSTALLCMAHTELPVASSVLSLLLFPSSHDHTSFLAIVVFALSGDARGMEPASSEREQQTGPHMQGSYSQYRYESTGEGGATSTQNTPTSTWRSQQQAWEGVGYSFLANVPGKGLEPNLSVHEPTPTGGPSEGMSRPPDLWLLKSTHLSIRTGGTPRGVFSMVGTGDPRGCVTEHFGVLTELEAQRH